MTTEPPTTPPTTDYDELTYQPSDLLDDDGSVDVSAVRSITKGDSRNPEAVTPEECARYRTIVRDGTRPRDVETDRGRSTVSRHATGRCNHDHDEPTAAYDPEANEWGCGE